MNESSMQDAVLEDKAQGIAAHLTTSVGHQRQRSITLPPPATGIVDRLDNPV